MIKATDIPQPIIDMYGMEFWDSFISIHKPQYISLPRADLKLEHKEQTIEFTSLSCCLTIWKDYAKTHMTVLR